MIFNEFELLTLREGLFSFYNSGFNNLTEEEFKQIENKIKVLIEDLK